MKMGGIIVETRHGTSLHAHDYASVGGSRREPVSVTPMRFGVRQWHITRSMSETCDPFNPLIIWECVPLARLPPQRRTHLTLRSAPFRWCEVIESLCLRHIGAFHKKCTFLKYSFEVVMVGVGDIGGGHKEYAIVLVCLLLLGRWDDWDVREWFCLYQYHYWKNLL